MLSSAQTAKAAAVLFLLLPAIATAGPPGQTSPAPPVPANFDHNPPVVFTPGLSQLGSISASAERKVATGVVLGGLAVCGLIGGGLLLHRAMKRAAEADPETYVGRRDQERAEIETVAGVGLLAATAAAAFGSVTFIRTGRASLEAASQRRRELSIAPTRGGASAMLSGTF